jgi:SOS-response transcriptional repressor LexA
MLVMPHIKAGNIPVCQDGIVPVFAEALFGNNPEMGNDLKSDILRRIDEQLEKTGKAATAVSTDAGFNEGFIRDMRRKKKLMPGIDKIAALATQLETTPEYLAFGVGSSEFVESVGMPVRGEVAAGLWHEVDGITDANAFESVPIALDPRYPKEAQYGLIVKGTSVNKVANPGDVLLCLDLALTGIDPRPGDMVIVERRRFQGREREVTAKRMRREGKLILLIPDSTDPAWQDATAINAKKPSEDIDVAVIAIVSGVWRPIRDR